MSRETRKINLPKLQVPVAGSGPANSRNLHSAARPATIIGPISDYYGTPNKVYSKLAAPLAATSSQQDERSDQPKSTPMAQIGNRFPIKSINTDDKVQLPGEQPVNTIPPKTVVPKKDSRKGTKSNAFSYRAKQNQRVPSLDDFESPPKEIKRAPIIKPDATRKTSKSRSKRQQNIKSSEIGYRKVVNFDSEGANMPGTNVGTETTQPKITINDIKIAEHTENADLSSLNTISKAVSVRATSTEPGDEVVPDMLTSKQHLSGDNLNIIAHNRYLNNSGRQPVKKLKLDNSDTSARLSPLHQSTTSSISVYTTQCTRATSPDIFADSSTEMETEDGEIINPDNKSSTEAAMSDRYIPTVLVDLTQEEQLDYEELDRDMSQFIEYSPRSSFNNSLGGHSQHAKHQINNIDIYLGGSKERLQQDNANLKEITQQTDPNCSYKQSSLSNSHLTEDIVISKSMGSKDLATLENKKQLNVTSISLTQMQEPRSIGCAAMNAKRISLSLTKQNSSLNAEIQTILNETLHVLDNMELHNSQTPSRSGVLALNTSVPVYRSIPDFESKTLNANIDLTRSDDDGDDAVNKEDDDDDVIFVLSNSEINYSIMTAEKISKTKITYFEKEDFSSSCLSFSSPAHSITNEAVSASDSDLFPSITEPVAAPVPAQKLKLDAYGVSFMDLINKEKSFCSNIVSHPLTRNGTASTISCDDYVEHVLGEVLTTPNKRGGCGRYSPTFSIQSETDLYKERAAFGILKSQSDLFIQSPNKTSPKVAQSSAFEGSSDGDDILGEVSFISSPSENAAYMKRYSTCNTQKFNDLLKESQSDLFTQSPNKTPAKMAQSWAFEGSSDGDDVLAEVLFISSPSENAAYMKRYSTCNTQKFNDLLKESQSDLFTQSPNKTPAKVAQYSAFEGGNDGDDALAEVSFISSPSENAAYMKRYSTCNTQKFNDFLKGLVQHSPEPPKTDDDEFDEFDKLVYGSPTFKTEKDTSNMPAGLQQLLTTEISLQEHTAEFDEKPSKAATTDLLKEIEVNGDIYTVRKSNSPKPDFTNQTDAELLKQLYGYGIKPLKRKRAIPMLEYIYNQTHPTMAEAEDLQTFLGRRCTTFRDLKSTATTGKSVKTNIKSPLHNSK